MPQFKRNYSDAYAAKILPATLALAKDLEGHRKVQAALAALGADQDSEGVYQIDSVPPKEQVGIVFDLHLWQNYQKRTVQSEADAARAASIIDIEGDFEHGGEA